MKPWVTFDLTTLPLENYLTQKNASMSKRPKSLSIIDHSWICGLNRKRFRNFVYYGRPKINSVDRFASPLSPLSTNETTNNPLRSLDLQ